MKLVIGITNTRDASLLSSFLDHIEQEERAINVMVFCLNLRLKNYLEKRGDSRIKEIVADSELHMICKNNNNGIPIKIKLKDKDKNFLARADRYISYGYYPFTRVMRKNYTDKKFLEWNSYVESKFNLIYHKLKKFDSNYGLVFSMDNGLAIYNYLYFVFNELNKKIFFHQWLRVQGRVTINDSIYYHDSRIEKLYHEIRTKANDQNSKLYSKSIDYMEKYIVSNKNSNSETYGKQISKESVLFYQFIKSLLQPWRLKWIINSLIKYMREPKLMIFDRIDSISIIIYRFRSWYYLVFFKKYFFENWRKEEFIYYPIHAEPEVSTLVHGNKYINQFSLLKRLALISKRLNKKLYVKNHPYNYQNVPSEFVKKILCIDNLFLIDHRTSGFDLMQKACLTVTNAGSGALECLYIGKKSITLSKTPFSGFENSPVKMVDDLTYDNIKKIVQLPTDDLKIKKKGLDWIITTFDKSNFNLFNNFNEYQNILIDDKNKRRSYFEFVTKSIKESQANY